MFLSLMMPAVCFVKRLSALILVSVANRIRIKFWMRAAHVAATANASAVTVERFPAKFLIDVGSAEALDPAQSRSPTAV
jgi:hypothetical protein